MTREALAGITAPSLCCTSHPSMHAATGGLGNMGYVTWFDLLLPAKGPLPPSCTMLNPAFSSLLSQPFSVEVVTSGEAPKGE